MNYYIRAPLERTAQVRRGKRVVHDKRYAVLVRKFREILYIEYFQRGIGKSFSENGFGIGSDSLFHRREVVEFHKRDVDAHLFKRNGKQVGRSAVYVDGRNNVVARGSYVQYRYKRGRLPRRSHHRADAPFQCRDFSFHSRNSGICQPCVEKSLFLKVEQVAHFFGGFVFKRGAHGNGKHSRLAVFRSVPRLYALGFYLAHF